MNRLKISVAAILVVVATLVACSTAPSPAPTIGHVEPVDARRAVHLEVPGGVISVEFVDDGDFDVGRREIQEWISRSARAVSSYLGRFPKPEIDVLVHSEDGKGITYGNASVNVSGPSSERPLVNVYVGRRSDRRDLERDWIMTHEMLHLGFPSVGQPWLEEGMATYVEPIARLRIGLVDERRFWADLVEGLPQGQPEPGDRGLDGTSTWGRRYWGGAMYCLLSDIEIRKRTKNERGLVDAFRGILAAGGTIETSWSLDQVFVEGEKATGVSVMKEMHAKLGPRPVTVDLDALWKDLGVVRRGSSVDFDDRAPLASIRRAISQR